MRDWKDSQLHQRRQSKSVLKGPHELTVYWHHAKLILCSLIWSVHFPSAASHFDGTRCATQLCLNSVFLCSVYSDPYHALQYKPFWLRLDISAFKMSQQKLSHFSLEFQDQHGCRSFFSTRFGALLSDEMIAICQCQMIPPLSKKKKEAFTIPTYACHSLF